MSLCVWLLSPSVIARFIHAGAAASAHSCFWREDTVCPGVDSSAGGHSGYAYCLAAMGIVPTSV